MPAVSRSFPLWQQGLTLLKLPSGAERLWQLGEGRGEKKETFTVISFKPQLFATASRDETRTVGMREGGRATGFKIRL